MSKAKLLAAEERIKELETALATIRHYETPLTDCRIIADKVLAVKTPPKKVK